MGRGRSDPDHDGRPPRDGIHHARGNSGPLVLRELEDLSHVAEDGQAVRPRVQLEGKKRITGEAFANGQRLQENEILGDLS